MDKLVSIIVPCYNQAEYLSETLESIWKQTYKSWECIIVNDGSLDKTNEVARAWVKKDSRFKYFEITNSGVSKARNAGIEQAIGEFILPVDGDDKISSDYLKLAMKVFDKDNLLKVVYCRAEKFGDVSGEWMLEEFSLLGLAHANMIFCSAIFRKSDWVRIGGYDLGMLHGWEDWEFWIAMLKDEGKVYRIDKICFYYRIKERSRNNSFESKKKILYDYLCIKHPAFFTKYNGSNIELTISCDNKEKQIEHLRKSKKNAINVLTSFLFGFKLFKNEP